MKPRRTAPEIVQVQDDHNSKKLLGRFYTPDAIAQSLANWALRDRADRVLDPSYGGCAFLTAAVSRLRDLGAECPLRQVFGVDVDSGAHRFVEVLAGSEATNGNFRSEDFLATPEAAFGVRVQCIIANPPYVRHHILSADQIAVAQTAIGATGSTRLSRTAGYWAYFVLHSLRFLACNGRMALVLPVAFLNARYAGTVRTALLEHFETVRVLVSRERLFPDAEETAVIVLADGFLRPHIGSSISVARTIEEIHTLSRDHPIVKQGVLNDRSSGWKRNLLATEAQDVLDGLSPAKRKDVSRLGDLATIRIGTVTGANHFFVLTPSTAKRLRIPAAALRSVIASTSDLPPLALTADDIMRLRTAGHKCLLLVVPRPCKSIVLRRYLRTVTAKAASASSHCARRRPWYRLVDLAAPDAFFTYVNDRSPRLVLNAAGALCTNAIHRIWFRTNEVDRETLALSALSSLTGLTAELYGRAYGGGALKLELEEVQQLHLALPRLTSESVKRHITKAAKAFAGGDWPRARAIADEFVLRQGLGLSSEEVTVLARAQDSLRDLRRNE